MPGTPMVTAIAVVSPSMQSVDREVNVIIDTSIAPATSTDPVATATALPASRATASVAEYPPSSLPTATGRAAPLGQEVDDIADAEQVRQPQTT